MPRQKFEPVTKMKHEGLQQKFITHQILLWISMLTLEYF